jgi:hypothetical protein
VQSRVRVLKELVDKSLYVADERMIAEAIMVRSRARVLIAEPSFRAEHRGPHPRSFRRDRDARSFQLSATPHLRRVYH